MNKPFRDRQKWIERGLSGASVPEQRIYLASRSPRRRALLNQIGVKFETLLLREAASRATDVDEAPLLQELPTHYTCRVARKKAETGWKSVMQRGLPRLPVLAADTAVMLDGHVFGKPENPAHAREMLAALSGRAHQVLTSVAVALNNEIEARLCVSTVQFRDLTEREICLYAESGEPLDKAGGYAIQGQAAAFIAGISGSYSGVMGLPLFETAQLLHASGIEIFI